MQCCATGGVWILLFSVATLFEYNVSTTLSPIAAYIPIAQVRYTDILKFSDSQALGTELHIFHYSISRIFTRGRLRRLRRLRRLKRLRRLV